MFSLCAVFTECISFFVPIDPINVLTLATDFDSSHLDNIGNIISLCYLCGYLEQKLWVVMMSRWSCK